MGLILSGAFSFSGMFAFLTAGSFVYIDIYGVRPDHFGYLFGLNIVAMIIMTSINGRLVKKVGSHAMLRFGLTVQLIAGLGLFITWLLDLGLWGTVPFVVLFIGTLSTIGSNSMGLLLSGYPTMAGTASSLAGTVTFWYRFYHWCCRGYAPWWGYLANDHSDVGMFSIVRRVLLEIWKKGVMSEYTIEIQNLVNAALDELAAEHKSGKQVNAPVANNHYLVRWVTRAIKSQRFPRCVGDDLTRWQKQAVRKGTTLG